MLRVGYEVDASTAGVLWGAHLVALPAAASPAKRDVARDASISENSPDALPTDVVRAPRLEHNMCALEDAELLAALSERSVAASQRRFFHTLSIELSRQESICDADADLKVILSRSRRSPPFSPRSFSPRLCVPFRSSDCSPRDSSSSSSFCRPFPIVFSRASMHIAHMWLLLSSVPRVLLRQRVHLLTY